MGDATHRRRLGKDTIICQILLGVSCGDDDGLVGGNGRECDGAEENSCEDDFLW